MFDEAQLYSPVTKTAEGGVTVHLSDEHPGVNDPVYRERRNEIAAAALEWEPGRPVPRIDYTEDEQEVWRTVCRELAPKYERYACRAFRDAVVALDLPRDRIPQLDEVTAGLRDLSGFEYVPAAGIVPLDEFYGSLADRRPALEHGRQQPAGACEDPEHADRLAEARAGIAPDRDDRQDTRDGEGDPRSGDERQQPQLAQEQPLGGRDELDGEHDRRGQRDVDEVGAAVPPDREREQPEAGHGGGRERRPHGRLRPVLDELGPGERDRAAEEERAEREQDLPVRVVEVAGDERGESDQGGGHEERRRPDPEEPAQPGSAHQLVFVPAFAGLRAFCLMKRSIASCASSSWICFGGDFIR